MKSKWKSPFWVGDKLFTQEDMELIHWTTRHYLDFSRTELARTICENLEWKSPNGKEQVHSCVELLEELGAEGILTLPGKRLLTSYMKSAPCLDPLPQVNLKSTLKAVPAGERGACASRRKATLGSQHGSVPFLWLLACFWGLALFEFTNWSMA